MAPPVLVCDFDGTWVLSDVGNELCDRFAHPSWRATLQRWVTGELSAKLAAGLMWSSVTATKEELVAYAHQVSSPRAEHHLLLSEVEAGRLSLILASGGYQLYIDPLLGHARQAFRAVYCHELFHDDAGVLRPELRHAELGCDGCALCKGKLVEELLRAGERVAFAGDGYTDLCVIGTGVPIFAVAGSVLERECRARGVAHVSFERWGQVIEALRRT